MEGSLLVNENVGLIKGRDLGFVVNKKFCRSKREFYDRLEKRNGVARAKYAWSKEFKKLPLEDVTNKYSHPKESHSLVINHYHLAGQHQPRGPQSNFGVGIDTSLKLQPERDESSIFDSAWATLRGKPWQSSSELYDESW